MSISSVLGQPVPIEINGKKGKLHPLSLYEVGLLESDYIAYLRRQALMSTVGLPDGERAEALMREAAFVSELDVDAEPIFEWVVGSYEGLCRAIAHCIEVGNGGTVTPREAGVWYMQSGKDAEGSPVSEWLIRSKLKADPTQPVSTTGTVTESNDQENSDT